MKIALGAFIVVLAVFTVAGQDKEGSIEGRVAVQGTNESLADAQVTLEGPISSTLEGRYTPNPALTPAMHAEIDALIVSSPFGYPLEILAVNVRRREALLLGLPDPGPSSVTTRTIPGQLTTQSDASGNFRFKNLAPGRYRVRVMHNGYFGPDGSNSAGTTTPVNVAAGKTAPPLVFALSRSGTISGRIRGVDGQPLPNMPIRTYRVGYENSAASLQSVGGTPQQTNDRGEYRVFNLPPGDYYVGVFVGLSIGPTRRPQDAYATTFYPGQTEARNAQRIRVNGSEISGIDFDVQAKPATVISGRVNNLPALDIVGRTQTASTFFVLPADSKSLRDSFVTFLSSASDRSNGQFEIRGVVPGSYNLMACTNNEKGRLFQGRTHIDVAAADLPGIVINMEPAVDMRARVTLDGAAPPFTMGPPPSQNVDGPRPQNQPPIPLPSIRLSMVSLEPYAGLLRGDLPLECSTGAGSRLSTQTAFDPNGLYTFQNVPAGWHTIQVTGLPQNAYIADMRIDGMSVMDGFNVGGKAEEIAVTIRTDGSTVEGTVRDEQQNAHAATVVLVPQRARRNPNLYKSVVTDSTGRFTFSGVAPGEYSVFAWETVPQNAWMNSEFIAPYEERGKRLSVKPTTSEKIEVQVVR